MEQCCTSGSSCPSRFVVKTLLLVGALNWGLIGLGTLLGGKDLNVVKMLLGTWPTVEAVVYVLVGLAAVYKLVRMTLGCCKAQ